MKREPYVTVGANVADGKRRVYLVVESKKAKSEPRHVHLGDWTPDEILVWQPVMEKVFAHGVEHGIKSDIDMLTARKRRIVAQIEEMLDDPF